MNPLRLLFLSLGFVTLALATTVIPPSFDELVRESELIFRGRVTAVKSGWSTAGAKPRIATWVTFIVERTLRGEAGGSLTLEFVGGTVGDHRLEVAGWPAFEVGDRGVFFVENRQARLCPLVRLRHGRYRIVEGGPDAPERVVRDDYSSVEATLDAAVPLAERSGPMRVRASGRGMDLAEFEARIEARSTALPRLESQR